MDLITSQAKAKDLNNMAKKLKGNGKAGRILGLPKLEDANMAGSRNSAQCVLILTEGDSAKSLAVAGVSSIKARDTIGVFPLKGKLLNVRDEAVKKISANEEIQNIIKILGLDMSKEYDDIKDLR